MSRMQKFIVVLGAFTALAAALPAFGASSTQPGVTTVPPIYLMHYSPDAPQNPRFVEQLREAPPDILHLGHAVPLNSIFGPTSDYSGWNPKLGGVAEILRRQAELREFVNRLHQAGVGQVICYVNPSILGGDHEKHLGFWAFYDRWEDYESLGIGPKPVRSPEQWMQRDRRSFAPWEPEPNYPLWRYQPCPNEPAWIKYQTAVVRLIAECGYDGVFVDDCVMECRHDLCALRFPEFVRKRYDSEILLDAFEDDLSLGKTSSRTMSESAARLRNAETYRFWQESMVNFLDELNRAGRAVNPKFFTLPNWGASARVAGAAARARTGKSSAIWRRASAFQLFEEDHPGGYFGTNDVIGYLLQFNYGLELGIRPAILSYGTTRRHVELGYAEAAAGGGGAYVEPTAAFPEVRQKWRTFLETNRALFEGFRLVAPVGLVLSFDEARFGNDRHLRDVFAAARTLYKLHIPFTAVPLENLTSNRLERHKVIIASEVQHLSDAQLDALSQFVRGGGRFLATGAFGDHDQIGLPRKENPLAGLRNFDGAESPPKLRREDGAAIQLASLNEIVPGREFAVVDALELRKPDTFAARLKALAVSETDATAYDRFDRWLAALGGGELGLAKDAGAVCTVAYEKLGDAEGSLTVHAVRYAVPTWGGDDTAVTPSALNLRIPLPPGWALERADVLTPEKASVPLEARVVSNQVRCELPPFEFYALLHLKLRR